VDRRVDTSDGYSYDVESAVPNWTADQLRGASQEIPQSIDRTFTQSAERLPPRVTDLASR
jgi:hypothetical protein